MNTLTDSFSPQHLTPSHLPPTGESILRLLDFPGHQELLHTRESLGETLQQLRHEIEKRRMALGYDYEEYSMRLMQELHTIQSVFEVKILQDHTLKSLFDTIVLSLGDEGKRKIMAERLMYDDFFDLITASMSARDYKESGRKYIDGQIYQLGGEEERAELINNLNHAPSLTFGRLDGLSEADLHLIMTQIWKAKQVDLGIFHSGLNDQKLKILFSHLGGVKEISFFGRYLKDLSVEKLHIYALGLSSIRRISFCDCQFESFSLEMLEILFGALKQVESVDFTGCNLGLLSQEKLHIIFGHLHLVREIHLGNNKLTTTQSEKLKIIFRSLPELKRVSIPNYDLRCFSDTTLYIIFSRLPQLKTIIAHKTHQGWQVKDKIITLFPHLKHTQFIFG